MLTAGRPGFLSISNFDVRIIPSFHLRAPTIKFPHCLIGSIKDAESVVFILTPMRRSGIMDGAYPVGLSGAGSVKGPQSKNEQTSRIHHPCGRDAVPRSICGSAGRRRRLCRRRPVAVHRRRLAIRRKHRLGSRACRFVRLLDLRRKHRRVRRHRLQLGPALFCPDHALGGPQP